jgi:dipeptidyl aminopeptidase/acylaminoacyl peptidase
MTGMRRFWLGLACAFFAAPASSAPLEAYGKLPAIEQADISASGRELGFIVTDGEERRIVVKDLAQNKVVYVGAVGSAKVRDIRWVGDDHLILVTTATARSSELRGEFAFAADLDLATRTVRPLLRDVALSANTIIGRPVVRVVDGQPTLFLLGISVIHGRGVTSEFRVDLSRGTSRPAEIGQMKTNDILLGADGRAVAQTLYDLGKWRLQVKTPAGWREVLTRDDPVDRLEVLGLGRDGRSVLVSDTEKDGSAWREISLDNGAIGPPVAAAAGQAPLHDPISGRLIGTYALVGDEARYTFFDAADAHAWRAVEAAFAGDRVGLVSWSNDRTKVVVRVDSLKLGPAYAMIDLTAHRAEWLGGEYQGLQAADISSVTPIRYKAADGFELSGYLTLPNGRAPQGLPLIVFPHGGPAARDQPGFDWWAQAMASRGYAVLQVNFRGSTGFSSNYSKAGFGEWGRKMQTDLSDGVRFLAAQGTADPKRVCIVGASYGGYAALAGATFDGGVYRCAVSFGGISDLRQMAYASRERGGKPGVSYWTRYTGANDVDDPVLVKYSPALQAASAYAPILLIHGKDDTVIPLAQSREMADALQKAGKPVEIVVQNHADHWLSLGQTRLEMLQATMAFVEKHNPPQ